MNDRLEFDIVCPNNHNKAVTFSRKNRKNIKIRRTGISLQHMRQQLVSFPGRNCQISKAVRQDFG